MPEAIDTWAHPHFVRGHLKGLELIHRVEIKSKVIIDRRRNDEEMSIKDCLSQSHRSHNSVTSTTVSSLSIPSCYHTDASSAASHSSLSSFKKDVVVNHHIPPHRQNDQVMLPNIFCMDCQATVNGDSTTGNDNLNNLTTTTIHSAHGISSWSSCNANATSCLVQPSVQPSTITSRNYANEQDDFMFQLSQVLDIETRPRHDDLDSILSWDED